jgi:hypothetical protein
MRLVPAATSTPLPTRAEVIQVAEALYLDWHSGAGRFDQPAGEAIVDGLHDLGMLAWADEDGAK